VNTLLAKLSRREFSQKRIFVGNSFRFWKNALYVVSRKEKYFVFRLLQFIEIPKSGRDFAMADTSHLSQPYDTSLKAVFEENIAQIIPHVIADMHIERSLNIEMIRPVLRGDKVHQVWYRERRHILHIEFETGDNIDMPVRMLTYHSILHEDYHDKYAHYPVISMIIYPFEVKHLPTSPYEEKSGDEVLLTFHFRVIPLYLMEAHQYVQDHVLAMYTLLPTMKGADKELLLKAIDEMIVAYKGDDIRLSQHLRWMGILLRRSSTVTEEVKDHVQRRIDMFDRLWEEDPVMQKWKNKAIEEGLEKGRVQGRAQGREEGREEGEIKRARWAILVIVQKRFPGKLQQAQRKVEQINDLGELEDLFQKLFEVAGEEEALALLSKPVEL
jgi:hypothetical protein